MLNTMQNRKTTHQGNIGFDLPYLAYTFVLIAFFLSSICALQIPLFKFGDFASWNTPAVFFTLAGLSFVLGIIALLFGIGVFKVKINRFYLAVFSLFCIGGLIGALWHGQTFSHAGQQGVIVIDDASFLVRGESICFTVLSAFSLFIFFNFLPATHRSRASGSWVARFFVLLALIGLVYSLVVEWSEYGKALNDGLFSVEITSWFGQKNVYAYYLLLGMFAEIFLLEISERRWRYMLVVLFLVAILFTGSKAAILMAGVMYIAYLIYRLIRVKKERRFAWIHALIPLISLVVLAAGMLIIGIHKPDFFSSLWNAFVSFFKDEGGSNVASRGAIWNSAISLTNQSPAYWIFGQGDLPFTYLLSVAMDAPNRLGSAHNFVLELLGRGGLIRLGCFLAVLAYVARIYVMRAKASFRDYFVPLLFAVMMIGRGVVESVFLFDMTIPVFGYSYLILIPVLSGNGHVGAKPVEKRAIKKELLSEGIRYYRVPLLMEALAFVLVFIPRPFAWIVASGIALFGLVGLLILFFKKRDVFDRFLPEICCLYLGLIACIACVALPFDLPGILASLSIPFLLCLSLRLLLIGLETPEALGSSSFEYVYARTLMCVDARCRPEIKK